jgi:hypothetical protein
LLQFPSIAGEISAAERASLEGCTQPGAEHVRELLDDLRPRPATLSAQVIERWADKPVVEYFQRLLAREMLANPGAALLELKAVLTSLVRQETDRRIKVLEQHAATATLSLEELEELRRLLQAGRTGT